ncbi:MAG: hypothetical protein DHS20C15_07960 [Planctomycetota bacterium]|nr:MAG: hypothetical protein DHS20C15_07960 [Planctomycetota bacterium]
MPSLRHSLLIGLAMWMPGAALKAQSESQPSPRAVAARAQIREARDAADALSAAKRALVFARRDGGLSERARIAEALLDAQLKREALQVLDDVLALDPDEPVARALLTRPELSLGVPRWSADPAVAASLRVQLQALGHGAGPVLRERVLAELQRVGGRQARVLLTELESSLGDARPEVRQFASLALRRLEPGYAFLRLQRHAVLDPSASVRAEAARGLRDADDGERVVALAQLLDEPNPLLRTRVAETLATAGYAAAVAPLMSSLLAPPVVAANGGGGARPTGSVFVGAQRSFLQGYEGEVATNSVIANPLIGIAQEGASLTATVQGVSSVAGVSLSASQNSLRRALTELTGESFPSSQSWGTWWEREGRQRYLEPRAARSGAGVE